MTQLTSPLLVGILCAGMMGIVSGLGPCAAPRLLALCGLSYGTRSSRVIPIYGAFTLGAVTVYTLFGCTSSLLLRLFDLSSYLYGFVSIALIASGIYTLRPREQCLHTHRRATLSGALFLGIASATIASPCCTPLVFAVLAMASHYDSLQATALLLASFATGSAAPSIILTAFVSRIAARATKMLLLQFRPLHAGLLIGIGAYYGVLA